MPVLLIVIILAAGEGTRMRSALPKVMHPIGGRSLVGHAIAAARATGLAPLKVNTVLIRGQNLSEAGDLLDWALRSGLRLRFIEPGKPVQNAFVESLNGKLRDECLNEHWFTSLLHARTVIETWRREYNEERPKKILGGLTPAAYAKQLAAKAATMNTGL